MIEWSGVLLKLAWRFAFYIAGWRTRLGDPKVRDFIAPDLVDATEPVLHCGTRFRTRNVTFFYRATPSVVVSVRPSVCPTHASTVPKRLNVRSRKQRHTIDQGLQFSDANNLGEITTGSLPTVTPNRGEIGSDRQFSTNISLYLKWCRRNIITTER